jgi:hypothetical protein
MVLYRSCCDLVLAGESAEDHSAADLVGGEVDYGWGWGLVWAGASCARAGIVALTERGRG